MKKRHGIASAGNWILDITKIIDVFPEQDTLANISGQSSNNGGAPYNILKDLARLQAPFPLYGLGLVGQDETGQYIFNDCKNHSIDTSQLLSTSEVGTSYTDVMLVKNTGRRTFFHYRGANAYYDLHHINLKKIEAKIFHLGYLLLLDKLDEIQENNKTNASLLLEKAQQEGFLTSVDLVSEQRDRFKKVIIPSLPYIDILFLNEYEAGKLSGINIDTENLDLSKVKEAVEKLIHYGVNKWVILHFPQGCVAGNRSGDFIMQGSVKMPGNKIVGATGAGDAFAAGTLFGIHEGWDMKECLKSGVSCAAMSLTKASCSDGIKAVDESLSIGSEYGYRNLK
jgi:sugar/nucleoside kinase (ribokinase family)